MSSGFDEQRVEKRRHEMGATLQNPNKRKALVLIRRADHLVQQVRDPFDRLRDKRDVGDSKSRGKRIHRSRARTRAAW